MKINLDKQSKVELLNALRSGILETNNVLPLKAILDERRPDLRFSSLSDEELDARIAELEKKLKK